MKAVVVVVLLWLFLKKGEREGRDYMTLRWLPVFRKEGIEPMAIHDNTIVGWIA